MPASPRSILRKRDNASNDRKHKSQDEAACARVYQAIRAEAIQRRARRTVGPSSEGAGPSHERSGSGLPWAVPRVRLREPRSERRVVKMRGKVFEDLGGGILINHGLKDQHVVKSDSPSVPTAPSTPVPTRPNSPVRELPLAGRPSTPNASRPPSPVPAAPRKPRSTALPVHKAKGKGTSRTLTAALAEIQLEEASAAIKAEVIAVQGPTAAPPLPVSSHKLQQGTTISSGSVRSAGRKRRMLKSPYQAQQARAAPSVVQDDAGSRGAVLKSLTKLARLTHAEARKGALRGVSPIDAPMVQRALTRKDAQADLLRTGRPSALHGMPRKARVDKAMTGSVEMEVSEGDVALMSLPTQATDTTKDAKMEFEFAPVDDAMLAMYQETMQTALSFGEFDVLPLQDVDMSLGGPAFLEPGLMVGPVASASIATGVADVPVPVSISQDMPPSAEIMLHTWQGLGAVSGNSVGSQVEDLAQSDVAMSFFPPPVNEGMFVMTKEAADALEVIGNMDIPSLEDHHISIFDDVPFRPADTWYLSGGTSAAPGTDTLLPELNFPQPALTQSAGARELSQAATTTIPLEPNLDGYGNPPAASLASSSDSCLGSLTLFGCEPTAEAKTPPNPALKFVSRSVILTPVSPLASDAPPSMTLATFPEAGPDALVQLISKLNTLPASKSMSSSEGAVADGLQHTEEARRAEVDTPVEVFSQSIPSASTVMERVNVAAVSVTVVAPPLTFHDTLGRLRHMEAPPRNMLSRSAVIHISNIQTNKSGTSVGFVDVVQARRTCGHGQFNSPYSTANSLHDLAADVKFREKYSLAEPVRRPLNPPENLIPPYVRHRRAAVLNDADGDDEESDDEDHIAHPSVPATRPAEAGAGLASSAAYMLGKAIGRTIGWCLQVAAKG